ncbi:hypothetical protein B0E33_01395 [Roseibium algicola]|uniref:Uncharacterized protein n=1 Tax=Roseibium algicola TaxID=2857014 RepID=A0ABM6HX10_9HYPH|nr:hypothetical protein [Roseibium aggregatum]AQQ02410.1 hypothetical protein B0E33_01395 [Roseibium aggregatum]
MSALSGGPCVVCRRRDDGVAIRIGKDLHWSCMDHIHLTKKALEMPRQQFDVYEHEAMEEAMNKAADRLEGFGTSDLFQMDEMQAHAFFRGVLDDFGDTLEDKLEKFEPQF